MARARQHRRRQRVGQAAADTVTAGGGAADGLHSRWGHRTPQSRRSHSKLPGPGPGPTGLTGINVLGWGCTAGVAGIAADSRHVWAACSDGLMFELDAATGAPVRVLTGHRYGFSSPGAIAADGARIWVANAAGNSVTELNAVTGTPVRVLTGHRYGFNGPAAILADGARIWVANADGNSVTELDAITGAPVRVLTGHRYGFSSPGAIAADGARIWVSNYNGDSVTELNATTGTPVMNGSPYGFNSPAAVAADGTRV